MIRDFCRISKPTLYAEVTELRKQVDEGRAPLGVTTETVDAIDQVRKVGNIGAHMEKDIDLVIPVEPNEAAVLISLTEMLFEEWYVARQRRQERLAELAAIAANKEDLQKGPSASTDAIAKLALSGGLAPEGTMQSDIPVAGANEDPETRA